MLLIKDILEIKQGIDEIKALVGSLPEWIALSDKLANDYGYKDSNGLREWCKRNIEPEKFKKFGKAYHIHKSAFGSLSLAR